MTSWLEPPSSHDNHSRCDERKLALLETSRVKEQKYSFCKLFAEPSQGNTHDYSSKSQKLCQTFEHLIFQIVVDDEFYLAFIEASVVYPQGGLAESERKQKKLISIFILFRVFSMLDRKLYALLCGMVSASKPTLVFMGRDFQCLMCSAFA